jgi:LPXTG-site transpeptidase (sortase) family protein
MSSKRKIIIVFFAGGAISLAFLFYYLFKNSAQPYQESETGIQIFQQSSLVVGQPVRLIIPDINVDAAFEYVGLTSEGAMGAPNGPHNVAWFELGPRPGENGSAVIAGHYGRWKTGEGSVFDDLNKLEKGDILYIETDRGESISFIVREFKSYEEDADASDVFILNDGKAHLNLITCEGVWDEVLKTYHKRLVVFTDKE